MEYFDEIGSHACFLVLDSHWFKVATPTTANTAYSLLLTDCNFQITDYRLQITDYRLLLTAYYPLLTLLLLTLFFITLL